MDIASTLRHGRLLLQKHRIAADAEIILSFVINQPREFIYAHPEYPLAKKQTSRFAFLIKKRAHGEPVAYLIGRKEFFGLNFEVNKNVLIPRPDTETLVETTLSSIINSQLLIIKVADIGTGSGCLAVALAKNSQAKILATDISAAALMVAKRNARRHRVASRIKFLRGDLAEPLKNKKIDILVANLPYLDARWQTASIKSEPRLALFARNRGLALIKRLLGQIAARPSWPRIVLLEFDPRQTAAIKKLAAAQLPQYGLTVIKDLAGRDRVAKLTLS